jgi:hypothetical protein
MHDFLRRAQWNSFFQYNELNTQQKMCYNVTALRFTMDSLSRILYWIYMFGDVFLLNLNINDVH